MAVPALLLTLMRFIFDGKPQTFQAIGAPLCGLFPFTVMFLVTSITMLRERTTGTLERLMTMPMSKLDLLAGYGIAFGILAAAQAVVVCLTGFGLLGLDAPHGAWLVGVLAILNALLGMALGLLLSAFARTEFQAVQFMPAFIFPQMLLCGLFAPRDQMAPVLEAVSWLLPFTYAYDALEKAISPEAPGSALVVDVAIVVSVTLAALALGALTLRRRTA
jgi:ABC-2 type transport system permease protein